MAKFNYYQDIKNTIWIRNRFSVEAESKEEADKLVAKFKDRDLLEDYDNEVAMNVESEYLYDTVEPMTVEENDGQSTIEILEPNKEYIALYDNK